MVFRRIGGPLVEFIRFSPRVLWYEVPNHQFKCYGVVLDEFKLILEVIWKGEVV